MHGDIGIGLIQAWIVCMLCNAELTWIHALVGVCFALLPDLDCVTELFNRGKVAAHAANPRDHRDGLHYPIPLILLTGIMVYFVAGEVYATIAMSSLTLHFLHDSVGTGWGVKWLWPFSLKNYKFFCEKDNRNSFNPVVSWTPSELSEAIIRYGDPFWFGKYIWSSQFGIEMIFFVAGPVLFWIFKTSS